MPTWSVLTLVAVAFFGLCLAQSIVQPWDADTAAVSLQGWDLVHGHLLLHGWWASDVNFYTFDAPIYGLSALVLGQGNLALHVAGALIYTLVFLATCWLAKGRTSGARFWLRVSLVAFCLTATLFLGALRQTLLLVPDHLGTMVFVLIPFTLYDRYAERRWAPWAMFAVLTLGMLGDATVRYIAVPSVVLVWAAELPRVRKLRTPRAWLALAAVASVLGAMAIRSAEKALGAYYLTPPRSSIAPVSDWGWHLQSTLEGLLSIFAVPVNDFPGQGGRRILITVFGAIALACGLLSLLRVVIRWTKAEAADRLLVAGFLIYLAAYCFSSVASRGAGGGYEYIGVVALLACLSARNLPALRLPGLRPLTAQGKARAVVATTAIAAVASTGFLLSGTELEQRRGTDAAQTLASWLQAHGYRYGLANYWDAAPITVYSGSKVQVRAILPQQGGFLPFAWGSKSQWYDQKRAYANFVVTGGFRDMLTPAEAEAAFGNPTQTFHLPGGYTVLGYSYNLLSHKLPLYLPKGD
jgi:hypothetical protein